MFCASLNIVQSKQRSFISLGLFNQCLKAEGVTSLLPLAELVPVLLPWDPAASLCHSHPGLLAAEVWFSSLAVVEFVWCFWALCPRIARLVAKGWRISGTTGGYWTFWELSQLPLKGCLTTPTALLWGTMHTEQWEQCLLKRCLSYGKSDVWIIKFTTKALEILEMYLRSHLWNNLSLKHTWNKASFLKVWLLPTRCPVFLNQKFLHYVLETQRAVLLWKDPEDSEEWLYTISYS